MTKFKVGQVVRLVKHGRIGWEIDAESPEWTHLDGLVEGVKYTVSEVSTSGNIAVEESDYGLRHHPDHFTAADPDEDNAIGQDTIFRGSLTDDCQPGVPLKFRE